MTVLELKFTNNLRKDIINVFVKHGIIDQIHLRNEEIIERTNQLKKEKLKKSEIIRIVSGEFNLGTKSIENILYRKHKPSY